MFIQDYPGFRVKKIPDPGSGSASKNLITQKSFLSSWKYDPDLVFSSIPDP